MKFFILTAISVFMSSHAMADGLGEYLRSGLDTSMTPARCSLDTSRIKSCSMSSIHKYLGISNNKIQQGFFKKHLILDSLGKHCRPCPEEIVNNKSTFTKWVSGTQWYFGANLPYEYGVRYISGKYQVRLLLKFNFPTKDKLFVTKDVCYCKTLTHTRKSTKGCMVPRSEYVKLVKHMMKKAEKKWNIDPKTEFIFQYTTDKSQADFTINLKEANGGRHTYYTWTTDDNPITTAHEIGHILGLNDEYKEKPGSPCEDETSIMCNTWKGKVKPIHLYTILRRPFCRGSRFSYPLKDSPALP